jgi:serine/threonine protein kinase
MAVDASARIQQTRMRYPPRQKGHAHLTSDDDGPDGTESPEVDAFLRAVAKVPGAEAKDAGRVFGEVVDGKYRIDSLLGRGGMGTVYRAAHLGTGREVALKVLVPGLTSNDAAIARFRREARTAGQMRHPNVVDVTDFGFAEQSGAYLVMELLHGHTLRATLEAKRRLPVAVVIDVIDQVCAALAEAHRRGILHRDLKPENIHLEPAARGRYRVRVLDFGIAKLVDAVSELPAPAADPTLGAAPPGEAIVGGDAQALGDTNGPITRLGATIGTPAYMSPEQWLGRALDARSDVYSLGVVAYEMLAGAPPFLGKKSSLALEHAELTPPMLAETAPWVTQRIASVVEAALAKDPAGRPPSAAAFAAALHAGAETTGKLLRRSIALGADHFVLFSHRCAILTLPPVVFAAIGVVGALLARDGTFAAGADAAAFLVTVLLYSPVSGLLVPLVADLVASRDSLRAPPPVSEAWRTLRGSLASTLVTLALMAGAATFVGVLVRSIAYRLGFHRDIGPIILPLYATAYSAAVAPFAGCAAVVAVERMSGLSPLRRSNALLRPMRRAAFGVLLFYTLLGQALPELLLLVLKDVVAWSPPGTASAPWVFPTRCLLLSLFNAALMPFLVIPPAVLYLRAREAEGNPFA